MKKVIIGLLFIVLLFNSACEQKKTAENIPSVVSSQFEAKFPNAAETTWEMENANEYEANFKLNGERTSANFDDKGNWLETETEIKVANLPAAVHDSLNENFGGFEINEASKINSAKTGECYEAEIEKGEETFDVLFTSDGTLLEKKQITEKEEDKD